VPPIHIRGAIRRGITDDFNAVSTILLAISVLFVSFSFLFGKRRR